MAYRSRQRVAAALAHEEGDRVPFDTRGFPSSQVLDLCAADALSDDRRACYAQGDFRYLMFREMPRTADLASYLPDMPERARLSEWGVGRVPLRSAEGYPAGNRLFHPLAEVNTIHELEAFPWPDLRDPACHEHLGPETRRAMAEGLTVVGQMSQTILETAYEMRGMEKLFVDFHERPDYVHALFETIAQRRCFQARRFAEAGVDVLRIGDDIATQESLLISPAMYREWIKPYHARVIEAGRRAKPDLHVLYHSDGALTRLLPDLIDAGVTAINPCQPETMPLVNVKRRFGDRLTLWGCCPSQSIYAMGTREQARQALEEIIRDLAPGGGLVVQFYNMLVTPRLLDNLVAFVETFYDLAAYR
jgi:uroporphyrinogen decarboxylase